MNKIYCEICGKEIEVSDSSKMFICRKCNEG